MGEGGDRVGPGYTKPPPEVGRLNFLQACRAEGNGGGRVAGAGRGVGGGGLGRFLWPSHGGGGGGRQKPTPDLLVPNRGPAHGLHPRFVVAKIWADRGGGVGWKV